MILILVLQLVIIISLIITSRRSVEDSLPFFCFFLVLMPLEAKLVIPGLFDLNTMRVSLLTLLVLYLLKRRHPNRQPVPLKHLMLLHIGWALLSTLYSLSTAVSFKQVISQIFEFYLMYYLLVRIISNKRTLYKIVYAMLMAMGVCCILSLFEVYASWSVLRIFPASNWITYNGGLDPLYSELGRGLRVRSTFPHPILFGDALAMCIPLNVYLLSIWERRRQRIVLWITLTLMFWAIYKTQSRGPWLAVCLCSILLFLMVKGKVRRYLMVVSTLASLVLLSRPGVWQSIDALYQASTDPTQPVGSSYLYRHALTTAIAQAVDRSPSRVALGYGLGTFRQLGLEINFLGATRRWYTCDNNWALFLYETGYIGLILIGALLFRALFLGFRNYSRLPRPENTFSGVLFISVAGFYFLMLSVAAYSWGQQGYMSWVLISLIVAHGRNMHANAENVEEELVDDSSVEAPSFAEVVHSHVLSGVND